MRITFRGRDQICLGGFAVACQNSGKVTKASYTLVTVGYRLSQVVAVMVAGRLQTQVGKRYAYVPYRNVWKENIE